MTSLIWKRKARNLGSSNIGASCSSNLLWSSCDDDSDTCFGADADDIDWLIAAKRSKCISLEDTAAKFSRLKNEGIFLAENERYWEAVRKWDEALAVCNDAALHEMKAQVLMQLQEYFPAVQAARQAVNLSPDWCVAHQTLGRAHTGIGELNMALKDFQRALHLNPADGDLRKDDLYWTVDLLRHANRKAELMKPKAIDKDS